MARTLASTWWVTPNPYTPDGRQTAKPGESVKYKWYAGDIRMNGTTKVATPIEFGATNLISSDPIKHSNKGAIGSLIIEPQGATWIEDTNSRAQATVTKTDGTSFREFVLQFQTDINLRRGELQGDAAAVPNVAGEEDPEDSGQKALNYRTEPMWKRLGYEPDLPLEQTRAFDYTNSLSNAQVNGDPVTPVFTAKAGTPGQLPRAQFKWPRAQQCVPGSRAHLAAGAVHQQLDPDWQQSALRVEGRPAGSRRVKSHGRCSGERRRWRAPHFGRLPLPHAVVLPVRQRTVGHLPRNTVTQKHSVSHRRHKR